MSEILTKRKIFAFYLQEFTGRVMFVRTVLAVLLAVCSGDCLKWENCGTKLVVQALRISGCVKQPCIFISGEQYRLEVDAISVSSSKSLPYSVRAGNIFEYDVSLGDACMHLHKGSSCPIIQRGQAINFTKSFEIEFPAAIVLRTYPTTVTAEMVDEYGERLLCAKMEVEVRRKDTETSILGIFDFWNF